MQILIVLLIFSITFGISSLLQKIDLAFLLKFNLALFAVRIFVAIIFFLFLSKNVELFLDSQVDHKFAFVAISAYLFLFYFYSKVLLKNFLRVGEIFARFSLDALPGEQMAIEAGKRDGIISIQSAFNKREEIVNKSLKFTSFETVLRIINSEPIIITILLVSALALKLFDYGTEGSSFNIYLVVSSLFLAANFLILSGISTVLPLSKMVLGSQSAELTKGKIDYSNFYLKVTKYFTIGCIVSVVLIFTFLITKNTFFQSLYSVLFLMIVSSVGGYLTTKIKSKSSDMCLIQSRDEIKNKLDNFKPRHNREAEKEERELEIILYSSQKNQANEEFLKNVAINLIGFDSLFLGISQVVLIYRETDSTNESIQFSWGQEMFERTFSSNIPNKIELVQSYFLEFMSTFLLQSYRISDVISVLNREAPRNTSLSYLNQLEYVNYQFLYECINSFHKKGIVVKDLVFLAELSVKYFDNSDMEGVISEYLVKNQSVLMGADGICRVVYYDKSKGLDSVTKAIVNATNRNIYPIILVNTGEEESIDEVEMGRIINIERSTIPSRIEFFPFPLGQ